MKEKEKRVEKWEGGAVKVKKKEGKSEGNRMET